MRRQRVHRKSSREKTHRRRPRENDESIQAFHTVHKKWKETFKRTPRKKGQKMPVELNTKSKSNQAFYNILLGVGAVIIMVLFCKVSTKASQNAPGNGIDSKQDGPTIGQDESFDKGQMAAGMLLESMSHKNEVDVMVFPSQSRSSGEHVLVPDSSAKGSRHENFSESGLRAARDDPHGPKLGLEARPMIGQHSGHPAVMVEDHVVDPPLDSRKVTEKGRAKPKIRDSAKRTNEVDAQQSDGTETQSTTCELVVEEQSELEEKESEPATIESSGPLPETRLNAVDELKQLKAKEDARKKLEDERNEAMARMAKLEEDQAKALEQEEAAEKAFKRFPYKARMAAVSKVGERIWERSSWRARVAAAQEAMQEDASPSQEKTKAPRKKGSRVEKRAKDS